MRPLIIAGNQDAPHTLELFLDYNCPFSAKTARTVDNIIRPLISQDGKYQGKVKVIFRIQVQPWHAGSIYATEAGLAMLRLSPKDFWAYSRSLFDNQEDYYDLAILDLSARQIREKLGSLASQLLTAIEVDQFVDLLTIKGHPNGGVAVSDDLKSTVKFSRQNGIHVSPTALWDGIIANEISSSWGEKEWNEFFEAKVKA